MELPVLFLLTLQEIAFYFWSGNDTTSEEK